MTHLTPLASGQLGSIPWSFHPAWFLLIAFGTPALTWLALAWNRAVTEDPHRLRRAGLRELRRLLARLRRLKGEPQAVHLHAWCQAAARTWGVRVSTPTEGQLTRSVQRLTGGDTATTAAWRNLWIDTDRALYAADTSRGLHFPATEPPRDCVHDGRPPGAPRAARQPHASQSSAIQLRGATFAAWLQRASEAAAKVQLPKRERWLPDRLSHWLPSRTTATVQPAATSASQPVAKANSSPRWTPGRSGPRGAAVAIGLGLMLVAAALTLPSNPARADQPKAPVPTDTPPTISPQTEKAAADALRAHWNDWAAHYNVAATQIQQGNWNYAVAHAAAAFLLNPSQAANRDNLRFAIQQTGSMDPTLGRLLYGPLFQQFPALLSPADWQHAALLATLILAAGLTALVTTLYLPTRRRPLMLSARIGIATGGVSMMVALISFNAYGPLARSTAGILVDSVNLSPSPTELVPERETSPAGAGSVVLPERAFLSWRQVSLGANVSGWIRENAVMPFYQTPRHCNAVTRSSRPAPGNHSTSPDP